MSHALPALLLGVCIILGLLFVPLGLPGLWVMVAGIVGYGWLTDFRSIGVATIAVVLGIAFLGEIVEAWLGFRFDRGDRRSRRDEICLAGSGAEIQTRGTHYAEGRTLEEVDRAVQRKDALERGVPRSVYVRV